MRNGKPYIYSISEIQDDPENGMFWFLFKTSSSDEGDLELITKSPAEVVPSNKQHLIFCKNTVYTKTKEFFEKRKFKLPKIELKKFTGDAKEYLSYWSQFRKIHEDISIPNEDKMQYLLQAVVAKTKAARVVENFSDTSENDPKAIAQLKERFGRDVLLVQIYVRDLLSMVMKNTASDGTKTDLPALYDEFEAKIRALERLGRAQEKYGDFLSPLLESCLSEEILVAWERSRNMKETSQVEDRFLEKIMNFLKQEVKGEEMVELARTGFFISCQSKKKGNGI
ncbi:hypothetical protein AVEN_11429-1 [Araneus ventricosus]|uniref:Uncharacterized protein n=1 Tax=Araneus ventricosus TaxID=182803 RepID=A0A4Y2U8J7_ARAVE|nr:hypothetical protein AVEN_11429-1 [Araneus ventricosus]